jgi:putative SOS response-associated peptidase YedK
MCGRYVSPDTAAIERQWQIGRRNGNPFPRRFNAAPTTEVPILRREDGELTLSLARWGLIPAWWKEAKPPRLCHNARLEEAAGKPLWRDAMRRSRCLFPAQGWYEWREKDKQPYYFARRDGRLACFAGLASLYLYEDKMQDKARGKVLTCAVLSTASLGSLAEVHERMPVVLTPEGEQAWLEWGTVAMDAGAIEHYPVDRRVNSSLAEGAELIEPMTA